MADVYDLVEKQHGIRFAAKKIGDHDFEVTREIAGDKADGEVEMKEKGVDGV